MIFEERRVAVTPMESGYRLGSIMEFAGYDSSIDPRRLELLRSAIATLSVEAQERHERQERVYASS
jgi:hypothetical protein